MGNVVSRYISSVLGRSHAETKSPHTSSWQPCAIGNFIACPQLRDDMSNLVDWLVENEPEFRKARLPSLYSDLSVQRSTNPEGYAANVAAWQAAMTRAVSNGKLSSLSESKLILNSSDSLLSALGSPQYGRPSGLGLVLDQGVEAGEMLDLKQFMAAEHSIYKKTWIPRPWAVLNWGLKQAGLTGATSYDVSGRLRTAQVVLLAELKKVSTQVMATQLERGQNLTDRVYTIKSFARNVAANTDIPMSAEDIQVLLRYMSRDQQLLSYDNGTVKFASAAASSTTPTPITTEDTTIASIKDLIENLEAVTKALEAKVDTLQANAQEAVKKKNKQSALSALKSKKLAERALQQRNDTLHQLQEVYASMEQAVSQVEILEAMQASTVVLKGLNKRIGSVEHTEAIVESLREQMAQVDEVGQVLREPLDAATEAIDEAEVDDELEALEKEEARLREEKEAEVTRQKLGELEKVEKQRREQQERQAAEENLQRSIERLDAMSLNANAQEKEANAEKVLEPAS